MVEISQETLAQTENRLLKVIAQSEFKLLTGSYVFEELSLNDFSNLAHQDALALVRDNEVWSQLVPGENSALEQFKVFSFHFENCLDNSGFVGWLASHLKAQLGTGVFVTSGQNLKRGGIFDYWGCPLEIANDVVTEVEKLIAKGKELQLESIDIKSREESSAKSIAIERLDHLVLTVNDIKVTCEFYSKVLGLEVVTFNPGRIALKFGSQKFNLHQFGQEIEPKAIASTPGSADFCLITKDSLVNVIEHLHACQIEIIEQLVTRTGALGIITSVYIRDPDQNLIEISSYELE